MKTALITGITGQDGAYLSKFLLEKNYKVIGLTRDTSDTRTLGLRYLNVLEDIEAVKVNLLDLSNLIRMVEKYKPDEIYNLAAQSSVGLSFEQPIGTLEFNIISTANILEAIRIVNPKTRFYNASSSEMYGRVKEKDLPVTEESVLHPVSPYSISKASAHWITINYREAYNLYSVCGILFNHESCLRGENFVTKKIIEGAVRIKEGSLGKISLGNLKVTRDWGYAPEYIKAMWLMLQQEKPDDFIICSGGHHTLEEFAKGIFDKLGLSFNESADINPDLYRPVDLEVIYGDNSKSRNLLKWDYNLSFDDLLNKLIEDEINFQDWKKANNNLY